MQMFRVDQASTIALALTGQLVLCSVAMNTTAARGWTRWAVRGRLETRANQPHQGLPPHIYLSLSLHKLKLPCLFSALLVNNNNDHHNNTTVARK